MFNPALVRIVAKQTSSNTDWPMNIRRGGRIVGMALIAQLRYWLNQVGLRRKHSLPALVMTESTVFSRLMYKPKLFWMRLREFLRIKITRLFRELTLPQRWNALEEKCQNIMVLNLVTAYNKCPKQYKQYESD
jgi:hypothetical protein